MLGISCLIWGLVVLLSTQAHNFAEAMAVRIALGMMEAVVTPGLNREHRPASRCLVCPSSTSDSHDRVLVHEEGDPRQADTVVLGAGPRSQCRDLAL